MVTDLASRLAAVRKEHNLSQEALAEKMGLSRQAVSKWERGESAPDTQNLIALAKLYGVSLDELLGAEAPAHDETVYEEPPVLTETPAPPPARRESRAARPLLYPKAHRLWKLVPVWLLAPLLYFVLGVMARVWHPTWLLFLIVPLYFLELFALNARTRREFLVRQPVFCLSLLVFLLFGFTLSAWRYAWPLLFAAPVYQWVVRHNYKK